MVAQHLFLLFSLETHLVGADEACLPGWASDYSPGMATVVAQVWVCDPSLVNQSAFLKFC